MKPVHTCDHNAILAQAGGVSQSLLSRQDAGHLCNRWLLFISLCCHVEIAFQQNLDPDLQVFLVFANVGSQQLALAAS